MRRFWASKISNVHSLSGRPAGYERRKTAGFSRRPFTILRFLSRLMTSIFTRALGRRAWTPFTTAVMSSRLPITSACDSAFSLSIATP